MTEVIDAKFTSKGPWHKAKGDVLEVP